MSEEIVDNTRYAPQQVSESALRGKSAEVIAQIRQMALERFDFFVVYVLKYLLKPFHYKMLRHQLSTPHSMVLAPRGGGKSTICDVAYVLWMIVRNPNIRICIASKSGDQAKSFLGEIKQHMDNNLDFRILFGDLKGSKWNEDEIVVATRTRILKEPTVTALGSGAGIPGFHFDLIIGDDLCDEENTATEHQRNKQRNWFYNVLEPTLEPEGELRIIGTRYHVKDLYGHFAEKAKDGTFTNETIGPHVFRVKALELDENTGEQTSFWPEKFTVEILRRKRHNAGLINFNLQYQNDPSILEGGIIKVEDLEPYVWHTMLQSGQTVPPGELDGYCPPLEDLAIFQGCDPAIGQKQENDFFAHATIGVSRNLHIYVLEIVKLKLTFNKQVDFILEQAYKWQPERIGIETVAYQQALAQAVKERGVWLSIFETKPRKDKLARARILSAYCERHEMHLAKSMYATIETLAGMPYVEHDDDFDAIDIAVEAAKQQVLNQSAIGRLPTNFRRR